MRARLPAIAFRLAVLTTVWLFGTATFTLAQEGGDGAAVEPPAAETGPAGAEEPPAEPPPVDEAAPPAQPPPLVVPDVHGLPYVFAKGVLEDAGFAWKVKGKVEGYASNLVATQEPAPGTVVLDTGFPRVVLKLETNPDYPERGLPEPTSPYAGTPIVLLEEDPASGGPTEDGEPSGEEDTASAAGGSGENGEPSTAEPGADEPETSTASTGADEAGADDGADATTAAEERPPAFAVAGAPAEPLDEMPLPRRARRLKEHVESASTLTDDLVAHWQYQHAWVVTGARFGWWRGAEALRILIGVDEYMQERWNVGHNSEQIARAALAEVLAKTEQ